MRGAMMNTKDKQTLREELAKKGLSETDINDVLNSFEKKKPDKKEKADDNKADVRHGTSCIGIVTKKSVISEW